MFPIVSINDDILDSPYFAAVTSSVKRATSKYLFDDPAERASLLDGLLWTLKYNNFFTLS